MPNVIPHDASHYILGNTNNSESKFDRQLSGTSFISFVRKGTRVKQSMELIFKLSSFVKPDQLLPLRWQNLPSVFIATESEEVCFL